MLAVRFGFSRAVPLPPEHMTYYRHLSTVLFPNLDDCGIRLIGSQTIPLASERSLAAQSVMELLLKAVDYRREQCVLIDLGGPDERDVTRPNVLQGAALTIEALRADNPDVHIGVLLPKPIASTDVMAVSLQTMVASDKVRVLAGEGSAWGQSFSIDASITEQVEQWTERARSDPVERFKKRLIRRVGQYRLSDSGNVIRHLYDGRFAHDEIFALLSRWLSSRKREFGVRRVAYDARYSTWFRAPVEAALRECGLAGDAIQIENSRDAAKADVILLPIVRTGTSLRRLLASRKESMPPPLVWAALAIGGQFDEGTLHLSADEEVRDGLVVDVDYALLVSANPNAADVSFWADSKLGSIEPDDDDLSAVFSADAMWSMVFEAGVTPETNVPPHRNSAGYVPHFGDLVRFNGTLIAAKVDALLRKRFPGLLPPSIAFLCPREDNASALADALRGLAGHDTIYVERRIIETFFKKGATLDARLIEDKHGTLDKLESLRQLARRVSYVERPSIVLLDEFHLSGGTLVGLYNLATAFKLPVLCSVSLASFGREVAPLALPHVTLYRFGQLDVEP